MSKVKQLRNKVTVTLFPEVFLPFSIEVEEQALFHSRRNNSENLWYQDTRRFVQLIKSIRKPIRYVILLADTKVNEKETSFTFG